MSQKNDDCKSVSNKNNKSSGSGSGGHTTRSHNVKVSHHHHTRGESNISRVLNFDDVANASSSQITNIEPAPFVKPVSKLAMNPGRSGSDAGIKLSKSASSSPSHTKLQHQTSQPVSFARDQSKNHPIRTSASASNVAYGQLAHSSGGGIQLRKQSYKNQQSHSLRYSGSGSEVSNLVRVRNSTLGKSAPALSTNVVSSFIFFF